MAKHWKKALSLLLTVCMMLSVLTVGASASMAKGEAEAKAAGSSSGSLAGGKVDLGGGTIKPTDPSIGGDLGGGNIGGTIKPVDPGIGGGTTCKHTGAKTYTTTATTHTTVCSLCGKSVGLAARHMFTYVTVDEATCTTTGLKHGTCTTCGYETNETVPMVEHKWRDVQLSLVEATCTTDGSYIRVCMDCETEETVVLPALGHIVPEDAETVEPTCALDGSKSYTCARCEEAIVEVLPATGEHVKHYADNEDGTHTVTCEGCDMNEVEECVGEWTVTKETNFDEDGEQERTCTLCGAVATEVIPQVVAVAQVNGEQRYEALQEALDAVKAAYGLGNGEVEWTVTLLNDTTENVEFYAIPTMKNINDIKLTIDLNGKTITGTGDGSVITIGKYTSWSIYSTFIITDTVGGGTITGGNADDGGAVNVDAPDTRLTLIINGGNFVGNTAKRGGAIFSNSQTPTTVIINGGTFTGNTAIGTGAVYGAGGAVCARNLTVNGGTFTGNTADKGGAFYVVGGSWTADLVINEAEISGNTAAAYGDDIVFGLSGSYDRETTLELMDVPEGMAWLVDGYNLSEESDRVSAEYREAFTADQWPNTNKTGKALIALKLDAEHVVTVTIDDKTFIVAQGATLGENMPANPTQPGYAFVGWFDAEVGGEQITADTPITDNVTLYPHWTYVGFPSSRPTTPANPENPGEEDIVDENPPLTGAPVDAIFADVAKDDWFTEAVQYTFDKGWMTGVSGSSFDPYGFTTRGMMVAVIHRMENKPVASTVNGFNDVPADAYFTAAVNWAAENGIIKGYGDGSFGPEDQMTREQFVAILFRYAELCGYDVSARADLSRFTDSDQISGYAAQAMSWANAVGMIRGTSKTTLSATDYVTRAQVATVMMRFDKYVAAKAEVVA